MPEVTDQYVRIPVNAQAEFDKGSLRTVTLDAAQGIKAIMGHLKGKSTTTIMTYLFAVAKGWDMAKGNAWVKEHKSKHASASWGRRMSGYQGDQDLIVGFRKANGTVQLMLTARTTEEMEYLDWEREHLTLADKGALKLNRAAVAHARALIKAGNYETNRAWAASPAQMNRLLGSPPNWTKYGSWHLGINKSAKKGTKGCYKFPFGTGRSVSKRALSAAAQRASQFGYESIQQAASALLELINAQDQRQAKADGELVLLKFEHFVAASSISEGSHVVLGEDGVPTEFRVREWGVWPTTKYGNLRVDQESASKVMAWFRKRGIKCVIDTEHQTYATEKNGKPAPAVGWFNLEVRKDGIWAVDLEWTDEARGWLKNKEYRYFSPTGQFDPKTGRLETLETIALTNVPATNQQLPLVASHGATTSHEEEVMDKLWSEMGLTPEADEDAAIAKLKELLAAKDTEHETALADLRAKADDEDPEKAKLKKVVEQVLELLNLKADASEAEIKAAVATLKAKAPEADKVAALEKQVLELKAKDEETRVEKQLAKFSTKITKANEDIAKEMARELTPEQFEANLKQWPDLSGPQHKPAKDAPAGDGELLTKAELGVFDNMAKAHGWTDEEKATELKALKDHKIKMNVRA